MPLTDYIITEYEISDDEKVALRLSYEYGKVSTVAFNNHSDILISRPGFPEIDIPIMSAIKFYQDGSTIYAELNKKGFKDNLSLGKIVEGDLEKAIEWIRVANFRIYP